jgi:hypothetical protein
VPVRLRPVVYLISIVLSVSATFGPARAAAEETGATGTLTGHVFFGPKSPPAARTRIAVIETGLQTWTDGKGFFRIDSVPLGHQRLWFDLRGEPNVELPVDVTAGETSLADVYLNDRPTAPPVPIEIGVRSEVSASEIEAEIHPTPKQFHVGDASLFTIRIHNRGNRPVLLVQSVDDSDAWASPQVKVEITGPPGGFAGGGGPRCGNNNGVKPEDFVEVAAGESFNPFQGGWLDPDLLYGKFTKPGVYTATFRYVTDEPNPVPWMRGPCVHCGMWQGIRDLLARVPALDLTATMTFEVTPR